MAERGWVDLSTGVLTKAAAADSLLVGGGVNVDGASDFSAGLVHSGGEVLVSGGNLQLNDSIPLEIGTGADDSVIHDGTNTVWAHSTGDLTFDNTLATGSTIMLLGSDTSATDFQVQNNSAAALFTIDGAGLAVFSGDLDVNGSGTSDFAGAVTIQGSLTVNGTTTTVNSETVLLADNHIYQNSGYTTAVAQTGGLVVNYLPTATATTTVGSGVFTAGVNTTSDPTVTTAGAATFSASDLVEISGAADTQNNGLFEVVSHAANLLTIRSTANGITDQVEDFTNDQFTANAGDVGAVLTKVTVSVMRAGTDGAWETGSGSATPLVFSDLASASGVTLQTAYDTGATITTAGATAIAFTLTSGDFTIGGAGAVDINAAADFSAGLVNSASEMLISGGNLQLNDSIPLELGTGADDSLLHNGTDTIWTHVTGDLVFDNTLVTGSSVMRLGTDTAATDFQVQNDSGTPYLTVTGAGLVDVSDGTLDIPAGTSLLIAGTALTTAAFTAANLDTLLDGSNADALHVHASAPAVIISGLTTTAMAAANRVAYISAANTVNDAEADALATAKAVGVYTGTSGEIQAHGVVTLDMTTAGGDPGNGGSVYLALSTADTSTGSGKGSATAPTASGDFVSCLGICIDNALYAGSKTVEVLLATPLCDPIEIA